MTAVLRTNPVRVEEPQKIPEATIIIGIIVIIISGVIVIVIVIVIIIIIVIIMGISVFWLFVLLQCQAVMAVQGPLLAAIAQGALQGLQWHKTSFFS